MKIIVTICFYLFTGMLIGHPVSLSWANVVIHEDHIEVRYRILAEDLIYFHHPEHDGFYNYESKKLLDLLPRHATLISEYFYVLDDSGQRLDSEIIETNPQFFPPDSIPIMDLMKYSISFNILIDLPEKEWDVLSFYQEISSSENGIPAVTLLSVNRNGEQKSVEISAGFPFHLSRVFNFQPANPSLLTSSFYTIQPAGTRHELTIPSSVLMDFMGGTTVVPEALAASVIQYFTHTNRISGNESRLMPTLSNILILENSEKSYESMVYLDLYYPSENPLQTVTLEWEAYSWSFRWMNSKIRAWDKEVDHTFSRFQPIYTWNADTLILKELWKD